MSWMAGTYRGSALLLGLLFLFSPAALRAEQISHHGHMVEAEGQVRDCLSCHDGAAAKYASVCTVRCGFSDSGGSHSILKPYPPRRKPSEFAPVAELTAKGIRLQDGMVTCVSCHNLRNPVRYHLIMENNGSRLCMVCHIKM